MIRETGTTTFAVEEIDKGDAKSQFRWLMMRKFKQNKGEDDATQYSFKRKNAKHFLLSTWAILTLLTRWRKALFFTTVKNIIGLALESMVLGRLTMGEHQAKCRALT